MLHKALSHSKVFNFAIGTIPAYRREPAPYLVSGLDSSEKTESYDNFNWAGSQLFTAFVAADKNSQSLGKKRFDNVRKLEISGYYLRNNQDAKMRIHRIYEAHPVRYRRVKSESNTSL
jgi:hypothetical protein